MINNNTSSIACLRDAKLLLRGVGLEVEVIYHIKTVGCREEIYRCFTPKQIISYANEFLEKLPLQEKENWKKYIQILKEKKKNERVACQKWISDWDNAIKTQKFKP